MKLGDVEYCAITADEDVDYVTAQGRCADVDMTLVEHWSEERLTELQRTEYHMDIE